MTIAVDLGRKATKQTNYPSVYTYVLGAQKNRLIETVLFSTHNICFGLEIRKLIFDFAHLSCGLLALDKLSYKNVLQLIIFYLISSEMIWCGTQWKHPCEL